LTSRDDEVHRVVGVTFANLNVSDGLIAYWPLNGSGDDAAGGGNDLTIQGNPTVTAAGATGINNPSSLALDGNGDGLGTAGSYPALLRTPTWTVSLWFRANATYWSEGGCGGNGPEGLASNLFSAGGDYFLRVCRDDAGARNVMRLS